MRDGNIYVLLLLACPLPAYAAEGLGTEGAGTAEPFLSAGILLTVLLLFIACLLAVIAGLFLYLRRQRRRLRRCQEHLVRYITNNLELKKQSPGGREPYAFYPPDVTPEEFTKIIDNMLKRIMFLSLSALLALPFAAQGAEADSAYVFRFVRGREAFFVPYRDNAPTLTRLLCKLDSCRTALEEGYSYVSVTGYISPRRGADSAAVRRTGYLRNSHVKSELITRAKLLERMFVTDKVIVGTAAGGLSDVVEVTFPAPVAKVERIAGAEAAAKVRAYLKELQEAAGAIAGANTVQEAIEPETEAMTDPATGAKTPPEAAKPTTDPAPSLHPANDNPDPLTTASPEPEATNAFLLRADLLRWATLTPDLGVEWRIDPDWSIQLNGTWTSWSWDGKNRRYALWQLSPEVRYHLGKQRRGYLGAMYHLGAFNYKLGDTGKQGDLMGGGMTGGYLLRLNRSLTLDFSLGIGYTRAEYDKYAVTNGVRVKRGRENKNYWGVNHAGITLVWQLK